MRLSHASHFSFTLAFGIALTGCTLAEPGSAKDENVQPGTSSGALIGAPLDQDHRFAVGICTGVLNADRSCPVPGTANTSRCSGTLVGPNLVLTARHCVEKMGAQSDPADFCSADFTGEKINSTVQITTNDSVLQPNGAWYGVQRIHTPSGKNVCNDDFVLLQLGLQVRDVVPVGIDLHRDIAQQPPAEVAIVGRGWIKERYDSSTLELIESDNGGLTRRMLTHIPFMCAPATDGACSVVDYWSTPPVFHFRAGQLGYGAGGAPGDSGAGVYAQDSFGSGSYLAISVHSTSTMAVDGLSSGGQGVRLHRHAPFIRQVVEHAALVGRYPVPFWAEE